MKRILIFSIVSVCILSSSNHVISTNAIKHQYSLSEYISAFKETAITEMNRTGVPASITLAQAILESGYGNSSLAVYANNHFGIKTKPDWKGEAYTIGTCCYKKYNTALESYSDHSDHLKGRKWYNDLFLLPITDYKQWAYGLKKAGYAEDPYYAGRLIKIIEQQKFYSLDSLYIPLADSSATE